jgi:hypothetical protein
MCTTAGVRVERQMPRKVHGNPEEVCLPELRQLEITRLSKGAHAGNF